MTVGSQRSRPDRASVESERADRAGGRLLSADAAFLTAAAATGGAAATAARAARSLAAAAQRRHAARGLFREANRQHPLFRDILALRAGGGTRRLAIQPLPLAAALDKIAHVDDIVGAQNDVIAARAQSVAGRDGDLPFAGMAKNFQAADDAPTVQVAVVQFVFLDDVVIEAVEILFGQQLAGEESRPAQAFESSASRANRLQCLHS